MRQVSSVTLCCYDIITSLAYECFRTEYAMDQGLNGYIIWEISGDLLRDLSTPLLDATNDRLNNPNVRCDPDMEDVEGLGDGMIEGRPWYPKQGLGYCVSDGKELVNFILPSQMFGSALACCDAIFQHNVECTSESLYPGGNGQFISVDEPTQSISVDSSEDNPWYPSRKKGFCVNDGKHKNSYIADDLLFSSAQDCCQAAFSFESSCTLWSLNPGSDGTWVDYADEGTPWYPQWKVGYCVSDGKHWQNFSDETSHVFNSAAACCDAVYSYNADCFSKSMSIADGGGTLGDVVWYPDGNGCSSEIPMPSWIVTTFSSNEECCVEYFGRFNDSCITGIQAVVTPMTHSPTLYPTLYPTLSPTRESKPIPNNIDAYDQDTSVTPQPTMDPATAATTPNQVAVGEQISLPAPTDFLFYPNFGDGTSLDCRTGGNEPDWVSLDMMKNTKFQCCESIAPPWSDQCHNHPYYPNFRDHSCVNDGNQPNWMAGDYLADEQWLCCHNFFRDSEMLGACAGLPECEDCDISLYLSSYYEVLNSQGRSG